MDSLPGVKRKRNRTWEIRYYHKHKRDLQFRINRKAQSSRHLRLHPEHDKSEEYLLKFVDQLEKKCSEEAYDGIRGLLERISKESREGRGPQELE